MTVGPSITNGMHGGTPGRWSPAAAVKDQAQALVSQMTLPEKAGQLCQLFWLGDRANNIPHFAQGAKKAAAALDTGTVGALLFVSKASEANRLQRLHLRNSRLKIPLLFGFDVIHGFRTIFPVPIAMAASWDPGLIERCQAIAAHEARSAGVHWTFAPMVDVTRDARWGRMVEGAGEDPYLGSKVAVAQVRGFQRTAGSSGIFAGAKHFAGYGASVGGRDYDEVNLSEYELRNVYLPPFRAAVEAGVVNIMTAYMSLNGVPATANRWLLADVLRHEWGFEGFTVSDANAPANLVHAFSVDLKNAAADALNAGLDMEMSAGTAAFAALPDAVAAGLVTEAAIDGAVARVLEAKIAIGLFDQPFVDEGEAERTLSNPKHRTLAQQAATRSAVLLRNVDGLLPLNTAELRLAVVGPLADSRRDTLGPWAFEQDLGETVTILEGLREAVGSANSASTVTYAAGVRMPQRQSPWPFGPALERDDAEDWADFDDLAELGRATDLIAHSDVAIVVLGERYDMSGEIASRATLDLPGRQLELLQAAVATGTPVVLFLMSGRPLDLQWAEANVPAILQIWYPGTRGGAAVADLIVGSDSPGGKLPFTWPRSAGQSPLFYSHVRSHDPDNQANRYWDEDGSPLYPFGFGLSYGSFAYNDLRLGLDQVEIGKPVIASVLVSNTSSVRADAVVQLYLGQRHGSSVRPVRELKGFQRIGLNGGQERQITFEIEAEHRRHWSAAKRRWIEDEAQFDVWVGADASAPLHASFNVFATNPSSGSSLTPSIDTSAISSKGA